ncbi:MAG TPA: hypothetical protein VFS08_16605 [Gemmatimonadaceae bacterium]|nr:hypothetical protein [Gemmatimonadaceae bacterium]
MPALLRRIPRTLAGPACLLLLTLAVPGAVVAQPGALTSGTQTVPAELAAPTDSAATSAAPASATAGPLVGGTRAGAAPSVAREARPTDAGQAAGMVAMQRSGLRESQIMMIVGGAAIVLGFVTGDTAGDILILGGAAVGLAGLYFYLH